MWADGFKQYCKSSQGIFDLSPYEEGGEGEGTARANPSRPAPGGNATAAWESAPLHLRDAAAGSADNLDALCKTSAANGSTHTAVDSPHAPYDRLHHASPGVRGALPGAGTLNRSIAEALALGERRVGQAAKKAPHKGSWLMAAYEKRRQEIDGAREEARQAREAAARGREEAKKNRKWWRKKLGARNDKGQPVMQFVIQRLMDQYQRTEAKGGGIVGQANAHPPPAPPGSDPESSE